MCGSARGPSVILFVTRPPQTLQRWSKDKCLGVKLFYLPLSTLSASRLSFFIYLFDYQSWTKRWVYLPRGQANSDRLIFPQDTGVIFGRKSTSLINPWRAVWTPFTLVPSIYGTWMTRTELALLIFLIFLTPYRELVFVKWPIQDKHVPYRQRSRCASSRWIVGVSYQLISRYIWLI